jgi:hypothetical protein
MGKIRSTRAWIATFAALCLLFAQMATAAYACPQLAPKAADVAMVAMVDCDAMPSGQIDTEQPSLCKAHCQAGQQSHDAKNELKSPTQTSDVLWTLVWVLIPVLEPFERGITVSHAPDRPPGTAPIYLVNQVFRL